LDPEEHTVVSAVLSLVIGVSSWLGVPVVFPVIGLALGVSAVVREGRLSTRKPSQRYLGLLGAGLNGLAIIVVLFSVYT